MSDGKGFYIDYTHIEAGHNAGMTALVAIFGYLMEQDRPETWGATALIQRPGEILDWIK